MQAWFTALGVPCGAVMLLPLLLLLLLLRWLQLARYMCNQL